MTKVHGLTSTGAQCVITQSSDLYRRKSMLSTGSVLTLSTNGEASIKFGLGAVAALSLNGNLTWAEIDELSGAGTLRITGTLLPYSDILDPLPGNITITPTVAPTMLRVRPLVPNMATFSITADNPVAMYEAWSVSGTLTITGWADHNVYDASDGVEYALYAAHDNLTITATAEPMVTHYAAGEAVLAVSDLGNDLTRRRVLVPQPTDRFEIQVVLAQFQYLAQMIPAAPVALSLNANAPALVLASAVLNPAPGQLTITPNSPILIRDPRVEGTASLTITQLQMIAVRRRGLGANDSITLTPNAPELILAIKLFAVPVDITVTQTFAQMEDSQSRDDALDGEANLAVTGTAELAVRISFAADAYVFVLATDADMIVNANQRADNDRTFIVPEREPAFVVPQEQRVFYVS